MWTQFWVVEGAEADRAAERCRTLLTTWAPSASAPGAVGAARFYAGPDDLAISDQYWQEFRAIQAIVSDTPRDGWRERFAEMGQRALGIPPRPGYVIVDRNGPRSPRPNDWAKPHGPRWVITIEWPGDPPDS